MRSVNYSQSSTSSLLFYTLIGIFTFFSINQLQAAQFPLQDSTKHGQMSQMDKSSKSGMHGDMQKMHNKMMGMNMTGNPDYDFAQMMIEHHKGAINMSKKEVNNGKDRQAISMAKEVINDQNKDLKELQAFVKKNKPSKTGMTDKDMTENTGMNKDSEMSENRKMRKTQGQEMTGSADKNMMNKMKDMQQKMMNMEMKGDQDQDWAAMMIMHHQEAIEMSEDYLDRGKDNRMKKMAQKMISSNKEQIEKLEDWQSSHE